MYDPLVGLSSIARPKEDLFFQTQDDINLASFRALLSTFHRDPHIRGAQFELATKWYLENNPKYSSLLEQVWRWDDWPGREGRDIGIDLVAKTKGGELWAIQCKCYSESQDITKSGIDSFLAASNSERFSYRLLFATTDRIGSNAVRTIKTQEKPVGTVLLSNLEASEVSWPLSIDSLHLHSVRERPVPMQHQNTAITDCVEGFKSSDRGQLIHACGTGKTLTGLWVHEALGSKATLVTAPSIGLISQTINSWSHAAKEPFDYIVVCSDKTVTKGVEHESLSSLGVPVTTDPDKIKKFLAAKHDRPVVVFSTYQSIPVLSEAQKAASHSFTLLVADEAHVCTGLEGALFTQVLDNGVISAEKRLFATATPKIFTERVKEAIEDEELTVCSMDDPEVFGPVFSSLSYRQALEAKLVSDYKVVVVGVTDNEVANAIKKGAFVRDGEDLETDTRSLGIRIALLKAIKEYDLRKVITFHSTVSGARSFVSNKASGSLLSALPFLSSEDRPSGEFWTGHINGATPAAERGQKLRTLKNLSPDARGVVSNCSCLGTGTDIPALDGIAIIDPKTSVSDIVQMVGRVTRKSEGKEAGVILIPVFIDSDKAPEDLLSSSEFRKVWQVIRALRSHDEVFAEELDELRIGIKGGAGGKLPSAIHFNLPTKLPDGFAEAIILKTVNACSRKPNLTNEQIKEWAVDHKERTGKWPATESGEVIGSMGENWGAINASLRYGLRGLSNHRNGIREFLLIHFSDKAITDPPEGWATNHSLSKEMGIGNATLRRAANRYRKLEPGWFSKFWGSRGALEHYAPQLVERLKTELILPPKGWAPAGRIGRKFGIDQSTFVAAAEKYRSSNPEWIGSFLAPGGSVDHYAPKLVALVMSTFQFAPKGWESINALASSTGISYLAAQNALKELRTTHPDHFGRFHSHRRGVEHVSPELAAIFRDKVRPAPNEWRGLTELARELSRCPATTRRALEEYRTSHPHLFRTFLEAGGYHELVSPELAALLSEKLKFAPNGWKTLAGVARQLGCDYVTVARRADRFREHHSDWFRDYLVKSGFKEHLAPELIEIIRKGEF